MTASAVAAGRVGVRRLQRTKARGVTVTYSAYPVGGARKPRSIHAASACRCHKISLGITRITRVSASRQKRVSRKHTSGVLFMAISIRAASLALVLSGARAGRMFRRGHRWHFHRVSGQQHANRSRRRKPRIDPVCVSLVSRIERLRQEGVGDKIEKAAAKRYKMTSGRSRKGRSADQGQRRVPAALLDRRRQQHGPDARGTAAAGEEETSAKRAGAGRGLASSSVVRAASAPRGGARSWHFAAAAANSRDWVRHWAWARTARCCERASLVRFLVHSCASDS